MGNREVFLWGPYKRFVLQLNKSKCVLLNRAPGAHSVFYLCLFSTGLLVYLAGSSISSYVCPEKYQATIETRPDWRRKVAVEQVSPLDGFSILLV